MPNPARPVVAVANDFDESGNFVVPEGVRPENGSRHRPDSNHLFVATTPFFILKLAFIFSGSYVEQKYKTNHTE